MVACQVTVLAEEQLLLWASSLKIFMLNKLSAAKYCALISVYHSELCMESNLLIAGLGCH